MFKSPNSTKKKVIKRIFLILKISILPLIIAVIIYLFPYIIALGLYLIALSGSSDKIKCDDKVHHVWDTNALEGLKKNLGRNPWGKHDPFFYNQNKQIVELVFVETNGRWFIATAVKRDDTLGIYRCLVGFICGKRMSYTDFEHFRVTIEGSSLDSFNQLVQADSVWSLMGEYGFWNDTLEIERTFYERTDDPSLKNVEIANTFLSSFLIRKKPN